MNESDPTKPIGDIQKDIPGLSDQYIEIGNSQYKFSGELQTQHFWLLGKSAYEKTKSILAIGEPHYVAEAQFSLFRGLEVFFQDNPELIQKTVFLAEGFPANQPISVKRLIETDPHPSDKLIAETLSSFLITGYMAYEWKHQQGIPIIGTENQELYEMSKEFATWCVEDPKASLARLGIKNADGTVQMVSIPVEAGWNFAVNVRNKTIAATLINQACFYENPILFVGTGHLNKKQDDEEFGIIKDIAMVAVEPKTIFGKHLKSVDRKLLENHSIHYYLQNEKIGYSALSPIGFPTKREEMVYQRLFQAQQAGQVKVQANVNYEGYLNWLLAQNRSKAGKVTTVTPDPDAAAEFVRRLKEQQKQEEERGVIYEAQPIYDTKYDWFEINPEKLQSVLGKETIWGQGIEPQGRDFEQVRNVNLGSNCPHIDDIVVDAMTVTQHKSMDLRLSSYQDVGVVGSTVSGYIDHLDETTRGIWSWTDKKSGQHYDFERGRNFQDRYLELGIPAGRATQVQIEKLLELQDYAQTKDVTLVIVEVP